MKLHQVTFEKQVNIPGQGVVSELHASRVALRYDRETNSLIVGDDGWGIGWGNVLTWKREPKPTSKHVCNVCLRQFDNGQALGGHRAQAHSVNADR